MKKVIIIFCMIVSCYVSQAQTKEETVAWINSYASKLLWSSNISVTEEGILTIDEVGTGIDQGVLRMRYICDLKYSILKNEIDSFKTVGGDYMYTYGFTTNGNKVTIKNYYRNGLSEEGKYMSFRSEDKKGLERVAKAIYHLAKLFGATEKPKENIF